MKENKEVTGVFSKIFRSHDSTYGIEVITIEKGKVIKVETVEENYPTVTLSKFGKAAFAQAQTEWDARDKPVEKS